jgi:hypothetical protein
MRMDTDGDQRLSGWAASFLVITYNQIDLY